MPINTYHDLINYIAQSPAKLLGKPGERFSYSNECYAILGALIKRLSGIPYAAFVRENLLQPMGMYRTTFSFEEMYEYDDVTALYDVLPDGNLRESTRWPCAPAFQAGGRLKSSATELLRLFQMLASGGAYLGRRFLTEENWRHTISPGYQYALHESYGHALITRPHYHGVTLIGHGGMGKGISAYGGFVPEEGYSAVVLCNLSGVPAIQLFGAVINMALGLPIDTPRNQYETSIWSPGQIEQYAGIYGSDEGNEFVVTGNDEQLVLLYNGVSTPVKRVTDYVGVFAAKGFEQELRFYTNSNDDAVGLGHDVRFIPRKE